MFPRETVGIVDHTWISQTCAALKSSSCLPVWRCVDHTWISHKGCYNRHVWLLLAQNFHKTTYSLIPITPPVYYNNQKLNELCKSG
ncbi:hypothetical protein Hanom_Chr07g00639641 [Helianthus anomalus]